VIGKAAIGEQIGVGGLTLEGEEESLLLRA